MIARNADATRMLCHHKRDDHAETITNLMSTHQRNGTGSIVPRSNRLTSSATRRRPHKSINAKTNYENYVALARAAALAGDRIETENYYQHAEHYFRLMKEQTG